MIAASGERPWGRDSGIVKIFILFEALGLRFKQQKFQLNSTAVLTSATELTCCHQSDTFNYERNKDFDRTKR